MSDPVSDTGDHEVIERVLSGAVTPATHPWLFEEDVLFFAVNRAERADPGWLLDRLADRTLSAEGRRAVASETLGVREQALAALADLPPQPG